MPVHHSHEVMLMQVIGTCDGSGRIVLRDSAAPADTPSPVNLDLETVLGDLPRKSYEFPEYDASWAQPLALPGGETVQAALERVLKLPSVCSKRFLTTKVDRCVTGMQAACFAVTDCSFGQRLPLACLRGPCWQVLLRWMERVQVLELMSARTLCAHWCT